MKHYSPDAQKRARCQHSWCTDCRTRRGHNRGNRRLRHLAHTALTQLRKEARCETEEHE